MINLKEQLHEGCTVHFRCGGSAVVEKYHVSKSHLPVSLKFDEEIDNYHSFHHYKNDGTKTAKRCLDDIVKIDPKPFDWKDAKQGMAFKGKSGTAYYYVADDFSDKDFIVVCEKKDCSTFNTLLKRLLTRYPEGDLK